MKKTMKSLLSYGERYLHASRMDYHFKRELSNIKKQAYHEIKPLPKEKKDEIYQYFSSYGYRKIDLDWHEYIFSQTGKCSKYIIPENFYHIHIEPFFTKIHSEWEDKAYMDKILSEVRFPKNYIRNVNGYLMDANGDFLDSKQTLAILQQYSTVVIKPSLITGGGRGVEILEPSSLTIDSLNSLGSNYVIQEKIIQAPELSLFNQSSVNTEKIISFLYKGEVIILTAILRVGEAGAITDTASTGKGYTVGIKPHGRLNTVGYNIYGKQIEKDITGRLFSNVQLNAHDEIVEIIKKAHKRLPYFGIISWDFAVDYSGEPILIEYNLCYPEILIYQMNNGPIFGELTDMILDITSYRKI